MCSPISSFYEMRVSLRSVQAQVLYSILQNVLLMSGIKCSDYYKHLIISATATFCIAGLPGMLAAALGAHVTLTDREGAPEILSNLQTAIKLNKLENR
jgi:hypothetical protein